MAQSRINPKVDYYAALGVLPTDKFPKIKKAYESAITQLYARKPDTPENRRLADVLDEAYAVIENPRQRSEYNASMGYPPVYTRESITLAAKRLGKRIPLSEFYRLKQAVERINYAITMSTKFKSATSLDDLHRRLNLAINDMHSRLESLGLTYAQFKALVPRFEELVEAAKVHNIGIGGLAELASR